MISNKKIKILLVDVKFYYNRRLKARFYRYVVHKDSDRYLACFQKCLDA